MRVPHPSALCALGWDSTTSPILGLSSQRLMTKDQRQPYCTTNTAVVVDTTLPAVAVIVTV